MTSQPNPVIELRDAFKGYTHDQDKLCDPAETLQQVKDRLTHLKLDVLQEIRRIDTGRLGIPVYFSLCGSDARRIIGTRKQMGKGATPAQAEVSAVMELVERFSFFAFSKTPQHFIPATRAGITAQTGERVMDYDTLAKAVHDPTPNHPAVRNFFENLTLQWTRAWSLTRQEVCWLPFDWFTAINEFNGPSAGNGVAEALLQGICEVVERHVSALVSREKPPLAGLDLTTVTDTCCRNLIAAYQRAGIQVYASDFSLNMGIPSVGVLAWDPTTFPDRSEIVWTAGTTPHPEKALSRALTETAQLAGDFDTDTRYVASGLPKPRAPKEVRWITNPARTVPLSHLPNLAHSNMRQEVESCVAALQHRHLEVLAINTTHPDLHLPAFYTMIPGAHFRERTQGASVALFAARILYNTRPPVQVLASLTELNRALPDQYYLHFYLGACHLALQDYSQALAGFNKAAELQPAPQDVASVYVYQGLCLKELADYRGALTVLQQALALDDTRTDIHNLMGFCHFKLKAHEQAIACFQNVLALDPGSAIDYANIASNYRDMGRPAEAIMYYRQALALDPDIDFARHSLEKLTGRVPVMNDE